jgi:hypothetical protein
MMIKDKNFIHINNKCVGILSLRTPNEWNLNIAIEAQDSHNSTDNTDTVIDPGIVLEASRSKVFVATYQSYMEDQLQLHR